MLLNSKKLAFLGLLLAVDGLLIILSGIIEFNTMFLLAAASFCVGIAIRESSKQIGLGFLLASILVGLILAPNKFYCITYGAFGAYILVIEYAYDKLVKVQDIRRRRLLFWVIKYITFNIMYVPLLFFLPKLFYQGELHAGLAAGFLLAGQAALFVFDRAYDYFQRFVWGKIRHNLKL
ncbi:MAG TPA: hypothetical protein GXX75_20560 [Clostridiales bacterium]|nr:hypothetical protein [Clostridiales bacterium]